MPNRDVLVLCGGATGEPRGAERVLELDIDAPPGSPSKVNLHLPSLANAMLAPIPDRLEDLLRIACYVFCADQFTTRESPEMPRLGDTWRRSFRFRIPVREFDFWRRDKIIEQLEATLSFLSEDAYTFELIPGTPPGLPPYFDLRGEEPPVGFRPDHVILFSGGLDSLAGGAIPLLERGERVALVSHRASRIIERRQRALASALKQKGGSNLVLHLGIDVNKGGEPAAEYTQRSRSFLFAAIGLGIARMFNKTEVCLAENGVVSLNLPIARHVIGTRSTRTTHPRVIADFQELFTLVAGTEIRVLNPLFWFTKTEVAQRLSVLNCQDLITTSFSCSRVGLRTRRNRHCGRCSQCIDRRFAILAAGLGSYEPADTYAIDLFSGERERGAEVTLAASYILAARTFANMSEAAFTGRYGEIYRAIPYIPGSPLEKVARLHKLHERHGKGVIEVVNRHLASSANVEAAISRERTNLLAMVQTSGGTSNKQGDATAIDLEQREVDAVEMEAAPTEQAASFELMPIERPIAFAVDEPRERVVFEGGVELGGVLFKLFNVLCHLFDSDQAANRSVEESQTLTTGEIAHRLKVAEGTVRKNVAWRGGRFRVKSRTNAGQAFRKTTSSRTSRHVGTDSIRTSRADQCGNWGCQRPANPPCRKMGAEVPQISIRAIEFPSVFLVACRNFAGPHPYTPERAAARFTASETTPLTPPAADAASAVNR